MIFNKNKKKKDEILELYKMMSQSIISNENKRLNANVFYTTIISALYTIGFSKLDVSLLYISIISIILSIIWIINIEIYKKLSDAKFKVISDLEDNLYYPIFNKEYEYFKKNKFIFKLTTLEKIVAVLYLIISLIIFIYEILSMDVLICFFKNITFTRI